MDNSINDKVETFNHLESAKKISNDDGTSRRLTDARNKEIFT